MASKAGQTVADLLAAGVLQSVVQWKVEGRDEGDFYGLIQRRFPDAYPASIKAAINRGEAAFLAGGLINSDPSIGAGVLSNIPVNPDRPAKYGKARQRFQYRVTVPGGEVGGDEQFITVFVQSAKPLNADEIRQRAKKIAVDRYAAEADKDPYKIRPTLDDVTPVIVSVERTY